MILDLFAGPGGWSQGLRDISPTMHADEIGIEWDSAACETRAAAGHRTIRADIADYPIEPFVGKVRGLIASPPCQDFSNAGKHAGIDGDRGQLVTQVMRWAEALRPEWIACEQVPPVLPIWKEYAHRLAGLGYSTWAGVLNAADYGVPQTRRRAILIASRVRTVAPPEKTHEKTPTPTLFGPTVLPWRTMADALAPTGFVKLNPGTTPSQQNRRHYEMTEPAPTIAFGHDSANWKWIVNTGCVFAERGNRETALKFDGAEVPAWTLTGKVGSQWQVGADSVRLSVADALVLQSFPNDYPTQGSKTKQFEQVGNAIPPMLAARIIEAIA